jgi:hypothetical protein
MQAREYSVVLDQKYHVFFPRELIQAGLKFSLFGPKYLKIARAEGCVVFHFQQIVCFFSTKQYSTTIRGIYHEFLRGKDPVATVWREG